MDPWTFGWSALAAIGQIAAALATFAAVIVALRVPFKKKLKIRISDGFLSDGSTLISVDAINTGNKSIKISMMGFLLGDKQILTARYDENQKILVPSDSTCHYITIRELRDIVDINPEINFNKKLYAFVHDGEGKVYKKKTKLVITNLISKAESGQIIV